MQLFSKLIHSSFDPDPNDIFQVEAMIITNIRAIWHIYSNFSFRTFFSSIFLSFIGKSNTKYLLTNY